MAMAFASGSVAAEQPLTKTRMCKFMEMGMCLKGKTCSFAHDVSELQSRPNLYKTSFCMAYQRYGMCRDGTACKYAHGTNELNAGCAVKSDRSVQQAASANNVIHQINNNVQILVPVAVPVMLIPAGSFTKPDEYKAFSTDVDNAWELETDIGDDDLESLGMTSRQTSLGMSRQTSYANEEEETPSTRTSESSGQPEINTESIAPLEKLPGDVFRKTKRCKYFDRGCCKKGEACLFAHTQEVQPRPNLYRTRLCLAFERFGNCTAGDACKYAHGHEQLRTNDAVVSESNSSETTTEQETSESPPSEFDGEDAEDAKLVETFLQVRPQSSSWMVHSSGLEFRVGNTFLEFKQTEGTKTSLQRSVSCGNFVACC
jgi:hypothetical protein